MSPQWTGVTPATVAPPTSAAPRSCLGSLVDCNLSYDHGGGHGGGHGTATTSAQPLVVTPTVDCPSVRDELSGVPAQAVNEVNQNLSQLDIQIAEANQRLVTSQGQGGANFVDNAILGPLRDKRVATLDRIAIAIGRNAARPTGLDALAPCTLANPGGNNGGGGAPAPTELPGVEGPNLELAGNIGQIVQPAKVQLDAFPEENHNPASDHNDFVNVNSDETMAAMVDCINTDRSCS